jgi:anti-anti-sigma factor
MSETAFSVEPEVDGDDYRLRVSGELDLETCKRFSFEVTRAERSDAKRILLDLSGVTFIDSSGVNALVEAHQRSARDGRRLQVFPVGGQVRDVLELTGVIRILDFLN